MASIDKTYTNSYKEYQEFKDWSKGKQVIFNYGKKVSGKRLSDVHLRKERVEILNPTRRSKTNGIKNKISTFNTFR